MNIKYKLVDRRTGEVFTNIDRYLVDESGNVHTVITIDGKILNTVNYDKHKFLQEVCEINIYEKDRATIEIMTEDSFWKDDFSDDSKKDYVIRTGMFVEAFEEGLYYFVDDKTGEYIGYLGKIKRIIKINGRIVI